VRGLRLTDGGVYDNMGLEPVWKDHAVLLVSNGGSVFSPSEDEGLIWRLQRYVTIQANQAEAVRKRWLMSNFSVHALEGTYWGIGSVTDHYPNGTAGYSPSLVATRIANIRTDLDAFSDAEAAVLENHGYLVADSAVRSHAPSLAAATTPLKVPNEEWMDEAKVRDALADSSKRHLPFGRR
jgi:NTE family protein